MIEDACEALGATYKGSRSARTAIPPSGRSIPNKQMTTGEGGAVTTHAEDEHELLVSLRNQGRLETSSWLQHGRLGYNYRLDDLSAALGIGQLEKLDRILAARSAVAERYNELLAGVDVETPLADDDDHVRSWFVYVVKLPRGVDRDAVMARLAADGIATAPYLPSIHLQSYMRERYGFSRGDAPGERGLQRAHDGAAVPRAARACRSGACRRRASQRSLLNLQRNVHEIAPELIGAELLVDGVGGMIVEVEAYDHEDPAAHGFGNRRTERNASMFLAGGHVYVYRSYGIHWCLNIVCGEEGVASAVLIRALEPTRGLELMRERRGRRRRAPALLGPGAARRRRSA